MSPEDIRARIYEILADCIDRVKELESENARLREELAHARRVVAAARGADDALRSLGHDSPGMTALLAAYDKARVSNG